MNKKIDAIQAGVGDIKQSLQYLHQLQHANTIKVIIMLNNISKEFKMAMSSQNVEELSEKILDNDFLTKFRLPINDLAILKELDKELGNEDNFSSMVKHFGSYVGTDGQGRGEILGKNMAEQIMTRELMTKMSWTGISRTVGFEKKFAFQSLKNLVKMFYKVLLKADSRWSYEKNEKLFSSALLRHAKQRAMAQKEKVEKGKNYPDFLYSEASNNQSFHQAGTSANQDIPQVPTFKAKSQKFSSASGEELNNTKRVDLNKNGGCKVEVEVEELD